MRRYLCLCFALAAIAAGCSRQYFKQIPEGFILTADNGGSVRLEVVTDEIIRVSSVPDNNFSKDESLIIVPQKHETQFEVREADGEFVLSTASLDVIVSKADGAVTFKDKEGRVYTSEAGRSFKPFKEGGKKAYSVRQIFDSPQDEAFYGLGQHQADEWNYKGKNEELYQYNTKISVPFIVSTRRYGILWDSYSFCRWGDERDYAHLGDVFKLYDKEGQEGALTGTYCHPEGDGSDNLIRREPAINQEYLVVPAMDKVQNAPDFNFAGSKVTFEGEIEPSESGVFRFLLYYAGYTKVFVDGKEVVPEIWRTAWNPNSHKFSVELKAGVRVPLRIEWKPDGGVSYCGLRVLSPVDDALQNQMAWWGEMQDQIDYYFIAADDMDGVISGYRTLTGKAPIMPKWALGFWQSRERYSTQEQLLSTLKEFRDRHIPIDNIVQDWQYWEDDQWGSHDFDASRYPDPKGMVDSIHSLNARFMISVWPKFYVGTEHFKAFDRRGWIYRTPVKDTIRDWLGYEQSFYDAYSEGARRLFWQQMNDKLFSLGVDAWWMDASEPNIHDCTDMNYRKAMCGPTALGPSAKYFNAYGLMNAEAIYKGQRSVAPDQRVFLLTRSGFAGLQRYSTASWSGDIGTRWEDMKRQISAGLNFAMSGIPWWTMDIGGFSVENRYFAAQQLFDTKGVENEDLKEWRELNTRWYQFGTFTPLFRAHGQFPLREVWNIAPENHPAYNAILEYSRIRYRMIPYIYSLAARTYFHDYTVMRALVMDYPDDIAAREVSDQFMFGNALMVCPVYKYKARSREVYLPEGGWYGNDGCYYEGGNRVTAQAPYDNIPLFVRAGEIIPTGSDIEWTGQDKSGYLCLNVYTGKDAEFTIYEDDGLTYNYEKGQYSVIPLNWNDNEGVLTIGQRKGSFEGMAAKRVVDVRFITPSSVRKIRIEYDGDAQDVRMVLAK